MKFKNILLITLPVVFLSGCSLCGEPKIIIEEKIVNIPVKCKIEPVKCNLSKELNDVEFVGELYKCNLKYKEKIKICQ